MRRIKAFDASVIHAGNRGIAIDHSSVARAVNALLDRMKLPQLLNEIRGRQAQPIDGLYYAGGDQSLDIPPYKMVDGPRGARAGFATAFPVAMARGATFDVALEREVGLAIGREVAAKGGNVVLAPTINLLRHPGWGRAQETYSEDTFHMGAMAVAFVSGAQNHVLASPKHFALNNLENTRFELSADVDSRTLHEVFLPHFKRCVVEAATASIMSAYNKVNGIYCSDHDELLTRILRDEWGFKGFVESDWFLGTRSTADAINAGLDIEMPAPYRFTDEKIQAAIDAGELTVDTIRRNAGHALHQKVAWRLAEAPPMDPSVVECNAHIDLARRVAEQSIVLLKNERATLPLEDRSGSKIALVGDLADTINLGDRGSSFVASSEVTTPRAGLERLVADADLEFFASETNFEPLSEFDATVVVAGLTYKDEGEFIPTAQQEAEGETLARGGDRADLALPAAQRDLILRAAAHSKRTIVVLEAGSAVLVDDWIDRVDALLMLWYPGREGGHALANVLFGRVNPSGRLPVSFPRTMAQLMAWDISARHVPHDLLHGYRLLDHDHAEPSFPFGFGLGYTTFTLDAMTVVRTSDGFEVRTTVTNIGARAGATVVQLYVGHEGSAVFRVPRELKGFGRVELAPGERCELDLELRDVDLRYYDEAQGWQLEPCTYRLEAGFSSRDLPRAARWRYRDGQWSTA